MLVKDLLSVLNFNSVNNIILTNQTTFLSFGGKFGGLLNDGNLMNKTVASFKINENDLYIIFQ